MSLLERIPLARLVELLPGVGPDRFQQRVSGRAVAGGTGRNHRLVDQSQQQVGHVELVNPRSAANLLDRAQCEVGGEDAETTKEQLLVGPQQVVAPLDGAQQRPLTTFGISVRGGEQAKPFTEPIENLGGRQ